MKSSKFKSGLFRKLNNDEYVYYVNFVMLLFGFIKKAAVGSVSGEISKDKKLRNIFLHQNILDKIFNKHGVFDIENVITTITDWNFIIKNIDKNQDRINIIKLINSTHYYVLGAIRENGYFILTYFEVEIFSGNELKSLLGRGDFLTRISGLGP